MEEPCLCCAGHEVAVSDVRPVCRWIRDHCCVRTQKTFLLQRWIHTLRSEANFLMCFAEIID